MKAAAVQSARPPDALSLPSVLFQCVWSMPICAHLVSLAYLGLIRQSPSPTHLILRVNNACRSTSNLYLAGPHLLSDERGSLLSADELKHRLTQLRTLFDYVLIDAPGAGVSGDAAILGQTVNAAVLVIEANSTRRLTARKAKETLDAAGVRLLGTVLHNRTFPIPEGIYRRI